MKNKNINLVVKETTTFLPENKEGVVVISGYANRYLDDEGKLVVDRSAESVLPSGYDIKSYMKNPILLYQHKGDSPVGKVINIDITQKGLYIEAEVHKAMSEQTYYGVENGILKTFSIGFSVKDATENDGVWFWTAVELLEVSIVSVPDNQESLFSILTDSPCKSGVCMLASRATSVNKVKELNKTISTIQWKEVDKAVLRDSIESANLPEDELKDAFLVVKDSNKKSTWKFPHHTYNEETKSLELNVGGLTSAYSAFKGALDNLPKETILDCVEHLEKHFSELVDKGIIEEVPEELLKIKEGATTMKKDAQDDSQQPDDKNPIDTKEPETTPADSKNVDEGNSKNDEPDKGKSDTPPADADSKDEPQKVNMNSLKEFVEDAKNTSEGLNTLLEVYMLIESTINEALENQNNKD